jgi:hypothetical protein
MSHNSMGLNGLLQGHFYLHLHLIMRNCYNGERLHLDISTDLLVLRHLEHEYLSLSPSLCVCVCVCVYVCMYVCTRIHACMSLVTVRRVKRILVVPGI